jgi:hypothetical protein
MDKHSILKKLLSDNRQTGSTTSLIKTTSYFPNGILVVGHSAKKKFIVSNGLLKADQVMTLLELESAYQQNNQFVGKQIFLDNEIIFGLFEEKHNTVEVCINNDKHNIPFFESRSSDNNLTKQINVKLSKIDSEKLRELNNRVYDGHLAEATMARIMLKLGMETLEKKEN